MDRLIYRTENELQLQDVIPVEIAGTEIGHAIVSEITDEWIEVVWQGRPYRLSPDIDDYLDIRRQITSL